MEASRFTSVNLGLRVRTVPGAFLKWIGPSRVHFKSMKKEPEQLDRESLQKLRKERIGLISGHAILAARMIYRKFPWMRNVEKRLFVSILKLELELFLDGQRYE